MDQEQLDRMQELAANMNEREKQLNVSMKQLSDMGKEADNLIQLNTSILTALSQLCEKQQELDNQRDDVKNELTSLKHQLLINQSKMSEVSRVAQIIIKEHHENKKANGAPNDVKMKALKTIEFLQNEITKATQKCMKSENMEIEHEEIEAIADNLEKVINELKKREQIPDVPDDIISAQKKEIQQLLEQED